MTRNSLFTMLDKWTAPLTGLGVIIGGVIWLTSLHSIADQNKKDIETIKTFQTTIETRYSKRLNNLEERLARIEGKLDMMIENNRR